MFGTCPNCGVKLRIPADAGSQLIRCTECDWYFRVRFETPETFASKDALNQSEKCADESPQIAVAPKQLFVALDVSTSVRRSLPLIHSHLLKMLGEIQAVSDFELALYLFNANVMAYPNEALCKPRRYDAQMIPSPSELETRVAGGTALLDTLDRVIDDASAQDSPDRRVVVLTDGWERSSRNTDPGSLRKKIDDCRSTLQVSLAGFVNRRSYGYLQMLVCALGLPSESYYFSQHQDDLDSIESSILAMSDSVVRMST